MPTSAAAVLDPAPDLAAFDDWQAAHGLRANTIRVRHGVLARLAVSLGKPLPQVTEADLLRWEQRFAAPRARETHRAYVAHVRAWYRWAIGAGIVATDPSARLSRVSLRPPTLLYKDDLRFAVDAAGPRTRAMLGLAAWAGLTCSEIAALDWPDLHEDRDDDVALLDVRQHRRPARTVSIAPAVVRALRTYGVRGSGPVFLGVTGQRVTAKSVSETGSRYLRLCGISATMADLRQHRPVLREHLLARR